METEIFVTDVRLKKTAIQLVLQSPSQIFPGEILLTYRNITSPISYPFKFSVSYHNGTRINAMLQIKDLTFPAGDWDLAVNTKTENSTQTLFPILGKRLRGKLILLNYCLHFKEHMLFFPMGSTGHQFIFRCRPSSPYDGFSTKLKGLCALTVSRIFHTFFNRQKIRLVYEKYCCTAQENGYYFFKYCMEQLPASETKHMYFILDRNSSEWNKMRKYKHHVVPFMSFRHLLYAMSAQLYISPDSRMHLYQWKPLPNLVSREINRHDIFFLQHGVLYLKRVDNLFGASNSLLMTYFLTSSRFEQDIVVREMGYQREKTPILGLARWDVLEDLSQKVPKNILLFPTWRDWLEGQNDDFFCNSDYYRHYMSLLHNTELINYLEEKNINLIFHIHPKLHEFMKTFQVSSSHMKLIPFGTVPINQLLMECSMMITDYSSACWDVYYLEKPVLFYQFDMELYEKTRGSYIDMEHDLFGDRCTEEKQLVNLIREYVEHNFLEKEKYGNMRKNLFAYRDHNNCKRIYDFITENYGK